MFPVLMQPFFSVARTNLETGLRAASSFAVGFRQLGELNEKTMQSALADVRVQWGAPQASEAQPALPVAFLSYASDLLSIIAATAADVLDAIGATSSQPDAGAPKLVLAESIEPPASVSASGETAIVDATGAVVAHVPE
ncbi:hypothetical protein AWB76_07143 [Caballeronia temeraria]|uniref:Phasin family protein n=1 Tax=Caballeronia temeraria TaxID=1777137 RepID=A0A158DLU7_9BURK|nr:hypothetical protein [Caballeronia temeraria]SAK95443.1 hypothetical protein AWB76_07143 [Caballeronia temeraria]